MRKFVLFLIIVIAIFLRTWIIGRVPISPDWDEVSLGYNSYSILNTGKDEYGVFMPLVLRSYDDYKPALYSYLTIPLIKTLGLNINAVRLPSIFFAVVAVTATYYLVKELFNKESLALLSSFLLAISPWHIQFSRIAFESNVGLTFNILGILFFIRGLRNSFFLYVSAILFGLNIYVYQSEKIFVPLIILALALVFKNKIKTVSKKIVFLSSLLFILIITPMAIFIFTNNNSLERAKGVSVFSENIKKTQAQKFLDDKNNKSFGVLFSNRKVILGKRVIEGYLSHYNLNWMFISGDLGRHHAPYMGLLYLFELPFLLIGIYYLIFGNFDKNSKKITIFWFLIAPVAASFTSGVPHAVRALNFLPTLQIFIALGFIWSFSKVSSIKQSLRIKVLKYRVLSIKLRFLILIFIFSFLIFNFVYYLDQYFVQQNFYTARDWQYGYKEIINELNKIQDKYTKIIVSNQPPMDQSYMFFLFYLKYNPFEYQKYGQYASGGFKENHKFAKFEFRPIDWNNEKRSGETLFIGRGEDFTDNIHEIFTVYYPDKTVAMRIVR